MEKVVEDCKSRLESCGRLLRAQWREVLGLVLVCNPNHPPNRPMLTHQFAFSLLPTSSLKLCAFE